jgi:SAM-dependent methyltransferase
VIGEKLGLYKAMAGAGPLSSQEVAERSGAAERNVREWLRNRAAGGYMTYDPESDRYTLPDEHALALADEGSPFYIPGVYESIASLYADEDQILEAFRSGGGMGWHEHDHRLFRGTERFFRPGYRAHLVAEWIPALEGVQTKLERGAKVADVGCGHGASTVIMADAFPNSEFFGFDYHDASIQRAREAAEEAGLGDRITFEVASAKDYPDGGYDLVCVFDCLHDMGDPVGASAHVLETLDPDGTWMIVEPFAKDRVEENLNPVGRVFYGASTVICTPASLAQEVGLALGAQPKRRSTSSSKHDRSPVALARRCNLRQLLYAPALGATRSAPAGRCSPSSFPRRMRQRSANACVAKPEPSGLTGSCLSGLLSLNRFRNHEG